MYSNRDSRLFRRPTALCNIPVPFLDHDHGPLILDKGLLSLSELVADCDLVFCPCT